MCRCQNFKKEISRFADVAEQAHAGPVFDFLEPDSSRRVGGDLAEQVAAVEDDFQIFVGDVGGLR